MLSHAFLASGMFMLASAQSADSMPSATSMASPSATEPCAIVASLQAQALKSETKRSTTVPAELAYECLQSVPVDQDKDAQLIDEMKLYLQWATDVAYFKDLPGWYDNPSFDFYGELDKIKATIKNGGYASEWDVQDAITSLFVQTGDNHIVWNADIGSVFTFHRQSTLVSVSSDGKKAPAVYDYGDLSALASGANFTATSVKKINGEDVQTYLRKVGRQIQLHDAHAKYNNLFPNQAGTSLGKELYLGTFTYGNYDGANTTLTYENGTVRTFQNLATVGKDFTGVDSGKSFFSKFCQPQSSSSAPVATSTPAPSSTPLMSSMTMSSAQAAHTKAPYYPPAEILHPGNAIGGYYLNDSDVAVLSIPTFLPELDEPEYSEQAAVIFQSVAREFIKQAATDGKKNLIVDLRFNGGGDTVLAFDLFKLLFPTLEPYQASRRHAHQAFEQLVDVANAQSQNLEFVFDISAQDFNESSALWEFAYQSAITTNDTSFESADQFYGPHTYHNDNFTTLRGWNLSNTFGFASNFTVTGYGSEYATQQPAFNASNIILLQDGNCASTCAIFSEQMRTVAGVETLVMGGLPNDDTPMQKVGGTKGWLLWSLSKLDQFQRAFYEYAGTDALESVNGTEIEAMNKTSVIWDRIGTFSVNAADGIRRGDESEQTPLQFVYEAAECRLYYTPAMVFNVQETWKAAAKAKWGNGTCNAGKGFGTLATVGDGDNKTVPSNPAHPTSSASALGASGYTLMAVVFAAFMSM